MLTASQRVRLMKEISQRLASESWSLLDTTLEQFGLPTTDSWNGSEKDGYVLRMIQQAGDYQLIDLARHVGYEFESAPPAPRVEPPFWRKGMLRLFITHLAAHKVFAAGLQDELLKYGIYGFVAHNDIEPTVEWQTQIETALATCDALIALLHDKFHQSNWTDQEIGFAMGRGVPVFTITFGETPYGFIGRFQAFNGNSKTATDLAKELFESYRKNKQTQQKMTESIVRMFENSSTFAEAKRVMGYLEELESWDQSFSSRINYAAEMNGQIASSFGVPARVQKLIAKWNNAPMTSI